MRQGLPIQFVQGRIAEAAYLAVGAFDENPAVADVEQFDFSAANPQQAQAGRRHVFEVVPVAAALGAEVALDIVEQAPQQGLAGLLGLDFQQQPQVPVHRLGQPARVAFTPSTLRPMLVAPSITQAACAVQPSASSFTAPPRGIPPRVFPLWPFAVPPMLNALPE